MSQLLQEFASNALFRELAGRLLAYKRRWTPAAPMACRPTPMASTLTGCDPGINSFHVFRGTRRAQNARRHTLGAALCQLLLGRDTVGEETLRS